jgi:hypothetical protein
MNGGTSLRREGSRSRRAAEIPADLELCFSIRNRRAALPPHSRGVTFLRGIERPLREPKAR